MLILDEIKLTINDIAPKIKSLSETLGIERIKESIKKLENITVQPNFWNNKKNSGTVLSEISLLKNKVKNFELLKNDFEDLCVLVEMAESEDDQNLITEIKTNLRKIEKEEEHQTFSVLLTGKYDSKNAILTLHSGAGGTEAQDWVEMLCRMYTRWADSHGYKTTILDFLDGEEAGLKSVSLLIEGENVYGFLKGETGVHRLVRISPFDSSGRRHTSFASIEVMPEINDNNSQISINPDDVKMDVFRASGAGGQHVNKTSSAVRLTHIPTGITVTCQNQRSQFQNRDTAMKILKSKLLEIKEREHLEKIEDIKGIQKEITWGSQIRSYTFMPYTLVKDHRTNFESGNIFAVIDGEIDQFISAYLKSQIKK